MAQRILLAKPEVQFPVKKQHYAGDVGLPTGLLYLAAHTRENTDSEVKVKDYRFEAAMGMPRRLEYDLARADIIGVTACTAESPDAFEILKVAKRLGKTTVMGGLYPTFNVRDALETGYVDYIVRGEGELSFTQLVQALDGKRDLRDVKGISFKIGDSIFNAPKQDLITDLNALPFPAYDLLPAREYAKLSPAPIYAARGCPMTCNFCTINELWDFRYRRRSLDNISEEIERLLGMGFERVHFKDETMTLNKKWATDLFNALQKANFGVGYKVKSRVDGVDSTILEQMRNAGVDTIHSGIESIAEETLGKMNKGIRREQIEKYLGLMKEHEMIINPVYMLGYPGETRDQLRENVEFIKGVGSGNNVITYVSFITPHPGSSFERESRGLEVLTSDFSRYTHKQPVAVPHSLGPEGLDLMVEAYHEIADATGMQKVNPRVSSVYIQSLKRGKLNERRLVV